MLVFRWQAPVVPDKEQLKSMFEAEGLETVEEVFQPDTSVDWHRHPFDEVRTVVEGEILFDIAGNQLLLRPGDKIVIPSNTKHCFRIQGENRCICLVATKAI